MHRPAERQVLRSGGVAEHHVLAGVDELADLLVAVDAEAAAGDGDADALGAFGGEVGRQVRHPRGRLGLAVHHDEVEAALPAEPGVAADGVGVQPAARLRHRPERRQLTIGEPRGVEQVEDVGHPGERRGARVGEVGPELLVRDGGLGEQQAGTDQQVAVHHRQAVAVVHRQRGGGAVVRGEAEVGSDALGVAADVVPREADQLGGTGGAGGAEQQSQLRVQVVARRVEDVDEGTTRHDVGSVRRHEVVAPAVRAGEQHGVATLERGEIADHRVDVVVALEQHQAAGAAELGLPFAHHPGQFWVAHRRPGCDEGRCPTEPGQGAEWRAVRTEGRTPVRRRGHEKTPETPVTSTATRSPTTGTVAGSTRACRVVPSSRATRTEACGP